MNVRSMWVVRSIDESVRHFLSETLDRFLNDYLAANPTRLRYAFLRTQ